MLLLSGLSLPALLVSLILVDASVVRSTATKNATSYLSTCKAIENVISSASRVYYPGAANYTADIEHWLHTVIQNSTCSVEPGTTHDVAQIIKVLAKTTTPFAIKSGGHAFNPGFSSTSGVQIALSRFDSVEYDAKTGTVKMGKGNTWDKVYAALEPRNVTVCGGRISGVGLGGYLLGGGYSYLTNMRGLALDSVVSYEVVLPSGESVTASETSHSDLFWGLKGGFNNFGIVTSAVVKAYPIGDIYGGQVVYSATYLPQLIEGLYNWSTMQNTSDAVLDGSITWAYRLSPSSTPSAVVSLQVFYNGASPPSRFLAAFDGIPYLSSSLAVRNFTALVDVLSVGWTIPAGVHVTATTASIYQMTPSVVQKYTELMADVLQAYPNATTVAASFEPFVPSSIIRPLSDGVFPHTIYASPLNTDIYWPAGSDDASAQAALDSAVSQLGDFMRAEGQPVDEMMIYSNYAGLDYGVERMFGPNLERAKSLRKAIDPEGVMLRAGGWKFV